MRCPRLVMMVWLTALLLGSLHAAISGELAITSSPAGGTAFVDDRYVGVTPVTLQIEGEGAHLVCIRKRGFEVWRGTATVGARPAKVEAQLAPRVVGTISVTTDPMGSEVYVDGLAIGKSPVTATDLELAVHSVQAIREGYEVAAQEVRLTTQAPTAQVSLTLSARLDEYLLARVQTHPEDVVAETDLAHEFAIRHQFDECLTMLGKAFDAVADHAATLDPDDTRRVYQEVDRLYQKQFDYAPDDLVAALRPRLVEALRAGITRRPGNGETYESLGALLAGQGDAAGALAVYEEGAQKADQLPTRLRLLGDAGSARYAKGTQLEKETKWQEAVTAYEDLVAAHPQLWCSENALSRICAIEASQLKQPDKAYAAARALVEHFPNSPSCPEILSQAASYLAQAQKNEEAAKAFEEIADHYPWAGYYASNALYRAALTYEGPLKDPGRALPVWEKLIAAGGHTEEGAQARKHAADLLRAQGNAARADALIAEVLRDFPLSSIAVWTETDPQRKQQIATARTAYQEAAKLHQDGKPAEALARCESLPDDCRNNYYGCQVQELAIRLYTDELKNPAKAVEGHLAFVARWPAHPECALHLYQAGYLLEATADDVPRALQVYQQCVAAYPQDRYAELCLYRMAYVPMYKQMHIDYPKARDTFLRFAEAYPHSDNARLARKSAADCQMQLRDTQKARAMYLQLMNEDPNDYASYLAASAGYTWIRIRKDAP